MKPKILLRIASIIMLLHLAGHTIGALTWKQAPNDAVSRVVEGMEREHFDFQGRSVTLASFFDGYGFVMIFVLAMVSCLLWLLSTSNDKRLLWPLTLFLFAQGILEWIYFFPLASVMSLLAGFACTLALKMWRSSKVTN